MNIKLIKIASLFLPIFVTCQLMAFEASAKKELLQDIRIETKKCIVQIVSNASATENENVLGFKSLCSSLVILSPNEAKILIDGEWLNAAISESAESDGGDLDDLTIINTKGQILATKTNIAAYDSIIVAMAGESDFKKIHSN